MTPLTRASRLRLLALGAATVCLAAPWYGAHDLQLGRLRFALEEPEARILLQLRLPRVALAAIAGSSLAVSGTAFQAVFRNPLTSPFTLGVSSGAALGAALYAHSGASFRALGVPGITWAAFAGSLAATTFVFAFARWRAGASSTTVLLAGVALSSALSSLLLFLHYSGDWSTSLQILRWMVGGLSVVGWRPIADVAPLCVAGSLYLLASSRELNLLAMGEEIAASRGLDTRRATTSVNVAASTMVGAVVSVCGPIGFVGLMVPHLCRWIVGADHRYLVAASLLAGAGFLVVCDGAARMLIAPAEIPVGVLTSLLGGPFFLFLVAMRRDGREGVP